MKSITTMNIHTTNSTASTDNNVIFIKGCIIWGLATIFYFFDNLLNVSPGAMKPELSAAFAGSATSLGALSAGYLWAYGLMQIPAGLLMDRVGPRLVLTVASIMCAVGCYLFASAHTLGYAIWGRVFIGIGASFAVVGCCKLAAIWFEPRRFALFMGLMVSVGMGGAAFGLATVNKIIHTFAGWREAMFASSSVAIALAIAMWLIVRDRPTVNNHAANIKTVDLTQPAKKVTTSASVQPVELSISKALYEVIFSSQAWYLAVFAGLMFMPTLTFGGLWGTPYLVEAHNFSRDEAGFLTGLIFIGWTFGGPVYGWLSDYLGKRNLPMIISNSTTLVLSLIIIYAINLSMLQMGILMFLLGFCSSGFVLAFVVMRENNRTALAGTAIGFMNMLNTFLGGAVFQQLIGIVLDFSAKDVIVTEQGKMFSLADYRIALLSIPVCLLISLLLLFKIKETNCEPFEQA